MAVDGADAHAGAAGDVVHLRVELPYSANTAAGRFEDALAVAARIGAQRTLGLRSAVIGQSLVFTRVLDKRNRSSL